MKKVAWQFILSLTMTVFTLTACQKQNDAVVPPANNLAGEPEAAAVAPAANLDPNLTTAPGCQTCSASVASYDLISEIAKTKFREGSNSIAIPGTSLKAVATYQNGHIVQWKVQDAKGRLYSPDSAQTLATNYQMAGSSHYLKVRLCVTLPIFGRICITIVIG